MKQYNCGLPVSLIEAMMVAATLTGGGRMQARCWALVASLVTLVGAVVLVAGFPIGAEDFAGTHWHWFAVPCFGAPCS